MVLYKCEKCDKIFNHKSHYINHIAIHEKKYKLNVHNAIKFSIINTY